MKIQILGGGCPNCRKLEANARAAATSLGIEAEFVKVTDSDEILEMGVLQTPAYAIDGAVQNSGKVFSPEEIAASLKMHADGPSRQER